MLSNRWITLTRDLKAQAEARVAGGKRKAEVRAIAAFASESKFDAIYWILGSLPCACLLLFLLLYLRVGRSLVLSIGHSDLCLAFTSGSKFDGTHRLLESMCCTRLWLFLGLRLSHATLGFVFAFGTDFDTVYSDLCVELVLGYLGFCSCL